MQAATILAALQKAAQAPRLAGIYISCITVSAVHDWDHDPILCISWSMPDHTSEIDAPQLSFERVSATVISRPSDTSLLLPRELATPAEIEDAVMQAAWQLGAWDMTRIERPPLAAGESWREAKFGLLDSFGRSSHLVMGQPLVAGAAADDVVLNLAARDGHVKWRFVPLSLSTPSARLQHISRDSTLRPDCTRAGEPWDERGEWAQPKVPGLGAEMQYQLGIDPGRTVPRVRPIGHRGGKASHARRLARRAAMRAPEDI